MAKYERTCIACGKIYNYCSSCDDYKNMPLWHDLFCDMNCKKMFNACTSYNDKTNTEKQTYELIKDLDLTRNYKPSIKKMIDEVSPKQATSQTSSVKSVDIKSVDIKSDNVTNLSTESDLKTPQQTVTKKTASKARPRNKK